MAKSDESGEGSFATVRVPLAGELGSLEGQLINEVFREANARRKGSHLANFLVMRGWLSMIHDTDARNRATLFRALDIPGDVIAQIEEMWPNPAPIGAGGSLTPTRSVPKQERVSPRATGADSPAKPQAAVEPQPAAPVVSAPANSPFGGGNMIV